VKLAVGVVVPRSILKRTTKDQSINQSINQSNQSRNNTITHIIKSTTIIHHHACIQLQENGSHPIIDTTGGRRPNQDTEEDSNCCSPGVQDYSYPRILHPQNKIHTTNNLRTPLRNPHRLPPPQRHTPILRRLMQHTLRPRPLQTGTRTDQHSTIPRRCHCQGYDTHGQIR